MTIKEKRQEVARCRNELKTLHNEACKAYNLAKALLSKYETQGIKYKYLRASSKAIKANENRQELAKTLLREACYLDNLCYRLDCHYQTKDRDLFLKQAIENGKRKSVYFHIG